MGRKSCHLGLEAQERDLKGAGVDKLFTEQTGDALVVTKLDGLALSVANACEIVERLQAKGLALRVLAWVSTPRYRPGC